MTPFVFLCSARKPLLFAAAITLLLTANLASAFAADAQWEKLEGCKLLGAPNDDGDSFYVEHKGKELHFRLYFADTPETNKRYADRVKEQAAYWGISEEQALQLAAQASKFSAEHLKGGFTILTKREDARGQSRIERYYALVKIGDKDLAEELVRAGLARVYGMRTTLPDGTSAADASLKLMQLERDAMQHRRGAWAFAPKDAELHKILTHRISDSGKRHNDKCRFFRTSNNRPCKSTEGVACKTCGG